MRIKKIVILTSILIFVFLLSSAAISVTYSQEDTQREFNIDELIENADVPDQMPVARDLPWYIDTIQKPATHILLFVCSVWDWFKTKTNHALHGSNQVRKLNHEHESTNA